MTETAKVELSNQEDTLESIAIAFGSPMVSEKFRTEVGQILENSKKYHGLFNLSINTEELSIEKLQERCDRYEKALEDISYLSNPLDNDTLMSVVANVAGEALAAIGGGENV